MSAAALLASKPQPHRRRHRRRHVGQHLPLRDLSRASAPPSSRPRNRADKGPVMTSEHLTPKPRPCMGGPRRSLSRDDGSCRSARPSAAASCSACGLGLPRMPPLPPTPDEFVPNAFIRIGSDGQVVLTMPYVEMGQGTYTSIPMLIAEELEVDLAQVRLEHAPPNEKLYGNPLLGGIQATGNSNAVRSAWKPLRQAGATARTMLIAAAAQRWNVAASSCTREKRRSAARRDGQADPLRRTGRRGGAPARPRPCRTQAAGPVHADRHAGQAPGHPGEGQRNGPSMASTPGRRA